MLHIWNKGKRNGNLNKLSFLKRGAFRAALVFCQMKGMIRHPMLVKLVEGIAELIQNSIGRKIFTKGKVRASEIAKNHKLKRIFPSLIEWVKLTSYIIWLGTAFLKGKITWINYYL
jgi:hypothetical protein